MPKPLCIQFPNAGKKTSEFVSDIRGYEKLFTLSQTSAVDFVSTGNIATDQFVSTLDGDPVVRTYRNFTINAGHTVTTTQRCKGLYLNILGNLTVNGVLSMTARGAYASGKYIVIEKSRRNIYYFDQFSEQRADLVVINKFGVDSIACKSTNVGLNSPNGEHLPINMPAATGNACGCGGGTAGALGGTGTSFSGGSGAGGACDYNTGSGGGAAVGIPGQPNGGAGGEGRYRGGAAAAQGGGGGAGNPGGACQQPARNGSSGTGGTMIIFVGGTVNIGSTGAIQSSGSNGGSGEPGVTGSRYASYAGAGSGGGAIHLFHAGSITNPQNITAPGGQAGAVHRYFTSAGGDGTVNIMKI